MTNLANSDFHYLEGFFPGSAFTDEHQLTQLRMLAKRLRMASLPQIQGMLAGGHSSKQKGRGLDLDQLRQYLPGDDIRSIDWRVTARMQTPHTRVYKEERERPVVIMCDQRTPMAFGSQRSFKSVVAAQCAAIIAWATLDHGDRVGAFILGDEDEKDFRPKQRAQHVLQILKALNEFNHKLKTHGNVKNSLNDCLKKLHKGVKPGTTIYLISDFFDLNADNKAMLFNLRRHNHVVALQIYDALEREMPPPGMYAVTDGYREGFLDTQTKHSQQAYREAVSVFQQGIEQTFKQLAINHHQIDASQVPYLALKIALEQRGAK
jgi:uncharacterized protein (DUF58 family)